MLVLAHAVVAVHATAGLFMLTGSLLALKWPRLILAHIPIALTVFGIKLVGGECPLTNLELYLRDQAGAPGYTGGFNAHYITGPLGLSNAAPWTHVALLVVGLTPNVIGYTLLTRRVLQQRRARVTG